uniref:Uncharacterized protein n=1 Tax=Rhipicephalus zambeziensis TaxID=60191 RepID=A0A224Y9C8_9ACAR
MKSSGAKHAPTAVVLLKDGSLALFPMFQQRQKFQIIAQYRLVLFKSAAHSFSTKRKTNHGDFATVNYHTTLILCTQRYAISTKEIVQYDQHI